MKSMKRSPMKVVKAKPMKSMKKVSPMRGLAMKVIAMKAMKTQVSKGTSAKVTSSALVATGKSTSGTDKIKTRTRTKTLSPAQSSTMIQAAILSTNKNQNLKAPRSGAPQSTIAAYRVAKFGTRFTANPDLTQQRSACESLHQLDPTIDDYNQRLKVLEEWRIQEGLLPAKTGMEVALLFLQFVDASFFSGLGHADTSKTLAALQARIPQFNVLSDWVARCRKASDGFAKRAPAGSRDPPPEEVVYAVVGTCLWLDEPLVALNELLRFLAGARPGEIDDLQVGRFIAPRMKSGCWSVLFNPVEDLAPGKTGEFDEGVIIDQRHIRVLHPIFNQLVADRDPGQNLWNVSPVHCTKVFNQALAILHVEHLNLVRYSWRHAAASHDLLHKLRSQEEVKQRYRWRSDYSMKRYTKAARVEYFRKQVPVDVLKYGAIIKTQLANVFSGQKIRPPGQ